jgi:biotin carboxyl carrier protein
MPSQIISIKVQKGDLVNENQPLLVVSSMKMESTIVANQQGVVKNIAVSEGQNVEAGFLLLQIEEK